jgi:hypothetical protein
MHLWIYQRCLLEVVTGDWRTTPTLKTITATRSIPTRSHCAKQKEERAWLCIQVGNHVHSLEPNKQPVQDQAPSFTWLPTLIVLTTSDMHTESFANNSSKQYATHTIIDIYIYKHCSIPLTSHCVPWTAIDSLHCRPRRKPYSAKQRG